MSRALVAIAKHIASLRDAEAAEDCWFVLPDEGDDSVNLLDFTVEVEGPATYAPGVADAEGARPSPYKGGLFRLQVRISEAYPIEAPTVKFITRLWHPQIHPESGAPCLDLLKHQWRPTSGLKEVLDVLRNLLSSPSRDDSVNSEAAREIEESWDAFDKHAAAETARYAMD